jgi:hypothetical protein
MNRQHEFIRILLITVVFGVLAFTRCAKQVAPVGGPQDTLPPMIIESEPPNYSVNFESDEVEIEFNEFIQFKEMEQQFLSSPPFEEQPDISLKGKGFKITFNEPLKDSTTYTLNFGNAIVDFHEGNPIRNFRYVFSTGPELDSLEVRGYIEDAFTLKPRSDILVMLYEDLHDSVPYDQIPDYVTRSQSDGSFVIGNIRADTFKIFALGDKNSNYLYDNPEEPIAFRDSLITFQEELIEEDDTIFRDTLPQDTGMMETGEDTLQIPDSLLIDTIIHRSYFGYPPEYVFLRLFHEDKRIQYLKTIQRKDPGKVDVIFNAPVGDSLEVDLMNDSLKRQDWYILESSAQKDSLTYWIKDSSLYNQRYLEFLVSYQTKDSLNRDVITTDTLEAAYAFQEGEKQKTDTLQLSSNLQRSFDLNHNVQLNHPFPIISVDTNRLCLYKIIEDSILQEKPFRLRSDSQDLNRLYLDVKWEPETDYLFQALPQALKTIYNVYHDTLESNFNTRPADYYGSLVLSVKGRDSAFIVQLIKPSDEKEQIVREKYDEDLKEGAVQFKYLYPNKYKLKFIFDRIENRRWDTGDYMQNNQPEKVIYHPEVLDVRSNWEYEIEWNVQKPSSPTETKP